MACAVARSGPSTRMLEWGRMEFEFFADVFFFIGRKFCRKKSRGQETEFRFDVGQLKSLVRLMRSE